MREILFRGKPKNEAEYKVLRELCEDDCENGFVYGSLVVSRGKYYICVMAIHVRSGIDNYITTMIEVFPETVGEGTGRKDKNGTKIFEGDVVTLTTDSQKTYRVVFEDGCFFFDNIRAWYTADSLNSRNIAVIGNIHDNPELLKG